MTLLYPLCAPLTCGLLLGGVAPEILGSLVSTAPCRSRRVGHDEGSVRVMMRGHCVTMSLTTPGHNVCNDDEMIILL